MDRALKFKVARLKKGLTQMQLREKAKTNIQTIINIEKGKPIDGLRVGTIKKLADVLECSVNELFFSEEE